MASKKRIYKVFATNFELDKYFPAYSFCDKHIMPENAYL